MGGELEHVVVGTAGHIDHGKSTLVLALTGIDPDRWEEEKRRGITIDLGFAHTEIEGRPFSFVDVPGHERFVHNMLAGATGLDLLMLVVAADESVMPQTREHLAICDLLGLRRGLVVLSRTDLVDDEITELVEIEVREAIGGTFLESAEIVRASGVTGDGLDAVRAALARAARETERDADGPWPRLGIDRVFAAKGFGAVVTGTLQGGSLRVSDQLQVSPGGHEARIRGLQVHGQSVEEAGPHRRVAVNLQGIDKDALRRGQVLTPRGCGTESLFFDADVRLIVDASAALEEGMRVRIHHGTAEVLARLRLPEPQRIDPGERGTLQARLEQPLAALPGDRFIIRRYSPIITLGGGVIADIDPPRWRRDDPAWPERSRALAAAGAPERLAIAAETAGAAGVSLAARAVRIGIPLAQARTQPPEVLTLLGEDRVLSASGRERLKRELVDALEKHHRRSPLEPGPAPDRLRGELAPSWTLAEFRAFLEIVRDEADLVVDRESVRLASHQTSLSGAQKERLERVLARLDAAGLEAVALWQLEEAAGGAEGLAELLSFAARSRSAVRIKEDLWLSGRAWAEMVDRLRARAEAGQTVLGVPDFKELFGLSRKYAIPLLERLDDAGITRRAGNQRHLRF